MSTSESPVSVEAFFGRSSRLAAVCSQPMLPGQRRLVLDISNTRLIRTSDHACSPPFRLPGPQRHEERCTRQFLLARPDEIHALGCGTGGWIEPTRFSRRSAHTRELLWFAML